MKAQVRIKQFDPGRTAKPHHVSYEIPFSRGDRVLGSLIYIYQNMDPCLSFRFNCRARHCGECSMMINGKPGLSCEVPMTREVTLEPLRNLPLIKDLVIDRNGVYRKVLSHLPRLRTEEGIPAQGLRSFPMEVIDRLVRLDECIQCLCCMAVCPAYKKAPELFPGPMGLLMLATTNELMPGVDTNQVSMCLQCGRCEKACPRHIPIFSEAITNLKKTGGGELKKKKSSRKRFRSGIETIS